MYATDFEYNNEKLSDYGMMICSFHGSSGTESVSSGADITFQQMKASQSSRFCLYASTYDNAYTTTFQICKIPRTHSTHGSLYFTTDEVSQIQRWLCRKEYHKFKIDQDGYRNLYWNAVFACKQIALNGRIAGLELTMYTDAPYAYADALHLEFNCTPGQEFSIYDASDEIGFIRPDIDITVLEDGIFTMSYSLHTKKSGEENTSAAKEVMRLSGCLQNEVIHIDGKNQIITSNRPEHDLPKCFNFSFPKICNTYGNCKNDFSVNLNCSIIITYSPIRKVGL